MDPVYRSSNNNKRPHDDEGETTSSSPAAYYDEVDDSMDAPEIVAELQRSITTKQRLATLFRVKQRLLLGPQQHPHQHQYQLGGGGGGNCNHYYSEPIGSSMQQLQLDVLRSLIEAGILPTLLLQLGFVLQRPYGTTRQEVEGLCSLLSLVVRHCPEEVRPTVNEAISVETDDHFVDLLAEALLQQRASNDSETTSTTSHVVSILHALSGSPDGAAAILRCRRLLIRIKEVLGTATATASANSNNNKSNNNLPVMGSIDNTAALLSEGLGILKNLTYYAEQDRKMLLNLPGFLPVLTRIAYYHHHNNPDPDKVKERLSSVFRNFVLSPDCRTILGQDPDFLSALVHMSSSSSSNGSYNPRRTVRNVLNVLHSLALDSKDSCLLLIFHGDGVVLNVLERLLGDGNDAVVRKRSARTLRLLVNDASAPLLVHRTDLMELLSHRALHDDDQGVRLEAAEAFAKCAGLVQARQPNYRAVLDALVQLAESSSSFSAAAGGGGGGARHNYSRDVLARALKEQASYPDNRKPMVGYRGAIVAEILASIASSSETSNNAKEDACCAILDLAQEGANLRQLSSDHVIQALVENAKDNRVGAAATRLRLLHHNDNNNNESPVSARRRYALRALARLASDAANRTMMVNRDGLVKALIQFASTSSESETKGEVKKTILLLVREL